jgi:dihydrofolate reductase
MRKLKLEIQLSVDGFAADKQGGMDWAIWPYTGSDWLWDKALQRYHNDLTTSSDCILLSRTMAGGFHDHWEEVAKNVNDPQYAFAKPITEMRKVVFSRTLTKSVWKNTVLAEGDYVEVINKLKKEPGKDIIVYGGATFVSSLIQAGLIDEFHLLINPTAIGSGLPIFHTLNEKQGLQLVKAIGFDCGVTVLYYKKRNT